MCPLIFGSFTHHQVAILTGYLAIATETNREKSSGSTYPYGQGAPLLNFTLNYGLTCPTFRGSTCPIKIPQDKMAANFFLVKTNVK